MFISVVVVTYNSSKYIIETLNSVLLQTYSDIELIISDDCSTDCTQDICVKWLEQYRERFIDAKFVQTPTNKGICGNYNHALRFANGDWIKFIAGDDILLPECITTLVERVRVRENKIFFGALIPFSVSAAGTIVKKDVRSIGAECYLTSNPVEQIHKMLDKIDYVAEGPTIFVHTETLRKLGGMNEHIPMCEDFPIALKFALNDFSIGWIEQPLVLYREYEESVAHSNTRFRNMINMGARDAKMQLAIRERNYLLWWHYFIFQQLDKYTVFSSPIKRNMCKLLMLTDIYSIRKIIIRK